VTADVRPEPTDEERKVLEAVLEALEGADPSPYLSAWRRSALEDEYED
jgi:hypothetical protein